MRSGKLPFIQMESSVTDEESVFRRVDFKMPVRPLRAAGYKSVVSTREAQA